MNVYSRPTSTLGKDLDIFDMGVVTYTLVILVVTGKLLLEVHWHTWISHVALVVSIAAWFGWCFGSNLWFDLMPDVYMSIYHLCGTPAFYFIMAACTCTALMRDFAWKYAKRVSQLVASSNCVVHVSCRFTSRRLTTSSKRRSPEGNQLTISIWRRERAMECFAGF